jgi:hypothetical protein
MEEIEFDAADLVEPAAVTESRVHAAAILSHFLARDFDLATAVLTDPDTDIGQVVGRLCEFTVWTARAFGGDPGEVVDKIQRGSLFAASVVTPSEATE